MPTFILPYPPSANRYWRVRAMGKRTITYVSAEAKAFKKAVSEKYAHVAPLTGDVEVHVDLYRPKRIGDLDNFNKVTFDALKGIAYEDDKQIVRIIANRHDDKENPRVEVEVLPF